YSPESLRAMDDAISTHFPEGDEPLPTTILPIGAYLGEVVRINLGGRWRIEESIFDSAVELAHAELYPLRRVAQRFEEGTSASLSGWYNVVAREGPRGGVIRGLGNRVTMSKTECRTELVLTIPIFLS